jgi:SAM-dependent methyltransferase
MPSLFMPPGERLIRRLGQLKNAVAFAFPQKNTHREDLPYAVRDLSRLLTTERAQKNAYWASPRLLGAYLHYFLPWNIFRLSWLLPGLPLNLRAEDKILDLGSGPLTLPLSVWLCGTQERSLPLTWICSDLTPRPLELGRDIFQHLVRIAGTGQSRRAESAPEQKLSVPWGFNLLRASVDSALRGSKGGVNLIAALNVLNELPTPRRESMEERLDGLCASMDRALKPGGRILLVEPGSRLGGKIVQMMRRAALARGFTALSPCTHNAACPLLAGTGRQGGARADFPVELPDLEREKGVPPHASSSWCHFGHMSAGAPEALQKLSAQAGLPKERVHLSFVLLEKGGGEIVRDGQPCFSGCALGQETGRELFLSRVVSEAIRLPERGSAYYVCMREGLGMLVGGGKFSSGSEVLTRIAKNGGRDPKTGAIFVEPACNHRAG